jgi:aminopeptidase
MRDPRATALAKAIVEYSCEVGEGDRILIELFGNTMDLGRELIAAAYAAGGVPFYHLRDQTLQRAWLSGATKEQVQVVADLDRALMEQVQCYVAVRGTDNVSELADVPTDKMALYDSLYGTPVHLQARVKGTRWCVLRYPNASMAQLAGMSTEAFEDFYYAVCTVDYARMAEAMEPLKALMEATDRVRIVGPNTDLRFSIKGISAVPCAGKANIPDGEVYTAPVRESVEGVVSFNAPSPYRGFVFTGVQLQFEGGRIVRAMANDNERITRIFDTDEGARYVGEFSLGVNPFVKHPMGDILFDEKIDGSFHFTPGNCYDEAYNGNHSAIHWDLVCIQRPEYGGGEIWFDDRLIRKDGRFVVPELECLNPERLA